MKSSPPEIACLTPGATGWEVCLGGAPAQSVATLTEAAAIIPTGSKVHIAVPAQTLVMERLTLPSTEREELAGMIRLQSEKTLPFPVDEVSSDFVMVACRSQESAVLSVTAPNAPLEKLCQPLRVRGLVPERATPFVFHVAEACPPDGIVLAVYAEQGEVVVAIMESGKLSWVHVLASSEAERFTDELPQLLLPAIMEGVPTTFSQVFLASDCEALAPALREFFEVAVETLPTASPSLTQAINLVPAAWQAEQSRLQSQKRLRKQLLVATVLALLAAIGAVIYLANLRHQAANLEAQLAALRPKVEMIQARQARSNVLGAAIDPRRYAVEMLYLLTKNLPGDQVSITEFDQTLDQWRVVGETPSASLASDYISRVKSDQTLEAYQINAEPPRMLANGHWQFDILGKL